MLETSLWILLGILSRLYIFSKTFKKIYYLIATLIECQKWARLSIVIRLSGVQEVKISIKCKNFMSFLKIMKERLQMLV